MKLRYSLLLIILTGFCIVNAQDEQHSVAITADNVNSLDLVGIFDNDNQNTFTLEIVFNYDGSLLAVPYNNWIDIWDVKAGELVDTISILENFVHSIAFHPNSNILVVVEYMPGSVDNIIVWDVMAQMEVARLQGHSGLVQDIAFNEDGSLLAGADTSGIVLWRTDTYSYLSTLTNEIRPIDSGIPGLTITEVGFLDNETLIAGTRTSIILIQDMFGEILQQFVIETPGYAFSHVDELHVTSNNSLTLFHILRDGIILDYQTGTEILRMPTGDVTTLIPHWDGDLILYGGYDFESDGFTRASIVYMYFINMTTGKLLFNIGEHSRMIQAMAFNHSYTQIASVDGDGVIRLWETKENN